MEALAGGRWTRLLLCGEGGAAAARGGDAHPGPTAPPDGADRGPHLTSEGAEGCYLPRRFVSQDFSRSNPRLFAGSPMALSVVYRTADPAGLETPLLVLFAEKGAMPASFAALDAT